MRSFYDTRWQQVSRQAWKIRKPDWKFARYLLLQVGSEIAVLDMGVKFSYQIPSFSVLIVDLRRVKLQLISEDGSVVLRDGFIRADPSLEVKPTPFLSNLKNSV